MLGRIEEMPSILSRLHPKLRQLIIGNLVLIRELVVIPDKYCPDLFLLFLEVKYGVIIFPARSFEVSGIDNVIYLNFALGEIALVKIKPHHGVFAGIILVDEASYLTGSAHHLRGQLKIQLGRFGERLCSQFRGKREDILSKNA